MNELEQEVEAIETQVMDICWYSRGSVSYGEACQMSYRERVKWYKYLQEKYDELSGKESMRQELI